jgi:hypothetical protein
MKISTHIKQQIEKRGPDSMWSFKDFSGLPTQAVAQTLSRLARSGFLNRVRKGVYYYPKITALGKSSPSVGDIVSKIANRKGTRNFLGYTAASYNLGLTTQVPNSLVVVGDHQNKTITIGGQVVQFRHRKVGHLKNADDQVVWALDALRNIQKIPGSTAGDALVKIIQLIKSGRLDISKLLHFAQHEPPTSSRPARSYCRSFEFPRLGTFKNKK